MVSGPSGACSAGGTEGAPLRSDDESAARCASQRNARHANLILVALGVLLVASTLASLMLGRYPITPVEAVGMLANLVVPIDPFWTSQQETLFFQVRLPRIVLAIMVGCSLATAGAAYQGTFQNPLVSPDILGASQGAAFGAACAILLGLGSFAVSASAFLFSIAAVLLVLLIGTRARGNHLLIVVLAGVMVSSLFQAGVSFTKLIADPTDQLAAITYWLMGSLTGARWTDMALAAGPIAAGIAVLFALRWRINVLTMGDDEASTMGVNARRVRLIVILAATLVTASSVAISGMIGWVGLVIPHFSRMVIGCDYRKLLPASMLMGASFLLIVDDIARLVASSEIPIGILTAFVGAPFFLYLITRRKQQL
ncbi:FecCD family ABC transporter permease [Eggerthella sinensis]|mgnify:CR=1 FL=1|uniref:FecCD family ABC transporter permease n=1 Tax=Eggerthella sinensis TaxID=242230 RepID=UPI00266C0C68|nr:iron ABC transporter permease [Eggerthella sinensis]